MPYPTIQEEALSTMCRYPPPFTLLPRLRDLCCHSNDGPEYARATFYIQFISPSLRTLQIYGEWPTAVRVICVAELCPKLDTFVCDCRSLENTSSEVISDLARAVLEWRSLTDVSLGLGLQTLTTVLSALAGHLALRSMTVRCYERPQDYPILPQGSFPSLRHLTFRGCWLLVVNGILGTWTVRPIQSISITMVDDSNVSSEELTHTMCCIQEHCEPLELLELLLYFESQDPDAWRLGPEHLAPVSHFSNLTHVVLHGLGDCDINGDACAQLARWWPRLECLLIGPNAHRRAARRLCPLGVLHIFAIRCPNLRELALPFTAHEVPETSSLDLSSERQLNLTRLHVSDAPIESPMAVAHLLAALFPNLGRVEYEELLHDEDEEEISLDDRKRETTQREMAWDLVQKTLLALQMKKEE